MENILSSNILSGFYSVGRVEQDREYPFTPSPNSKEQDTEQPTSTLSTAWQRRELLSVESPRV